MSQGKEEKQEERIMEMPSIILNRDGSFGKTEDYKRSNHEDFCTSKELKDRNFCGVRHNSVAGSREIWIDGELRGSLSDSIISQFPKAWAELYSEVFGLKDVEELKGGN